jgi:lactoylglutathione lyase
MKNTVLPILLFVSAILITRGDSLAQIHFSHSTVYVVDLEKSVDFYEHVLGLKKINEPFKDGRHVWFQVADHGQLHVVKGSKAIVPHDVNIHLAFSVPSLDKFIAVLKEKNWKYGNFTGEEKSVALRPDGIHQIYLQDPDGYWIEINDDTY